MHHDLCINQVYWKKDTNLLKNIQTSRSGRGEKRVPMKNSFEREKVEVSFYFFNARSFIPCRGVCIGFWKLVKQSFLETKHKTAYLCTKVLPYLPLCKTALLFRSGS